MVWVSVFCGAVSAGAWLLSALISPIIVETTWDGPSAPIVRRMKLGSALNAAGALFAAISIGLQAYSMALNAG
jgi:hypothetical protein